MPHGKVEDHQIDVELEVRSLADPLEYCRCRHQFEIDDLAVPVLRYEVSRHFEIVHEQHVIADPEPSLHPVRDGASGNRLAHQARRDRGLLLTLFQQSLTDPMLVADPAGNKVVELVWCNLLAWGSTPD